MWSAVGERATPKYDRLGPGFQPRHGCKPYHGRGRVCRPFFTVGVHVKTIIHRSRFLHDCNRYHRSTRVLQALPIAASDRRSLWASHTPHPASKFTLTPANIHPENSKICKVSRGHFAKLQSVPGTLCKTAKCPGETLYHTILLAKFPRDTLQFCLTLAEMAVGQHRPGSTDFASC